MADAVQGAEGAFAFLHGEAIGVIGEVGALGVQQRIVIAAAEFDGHFAGDGFGDPALQGLAQHEGLRVEPTAFVEQAAEAAAHVAVLLHGAFVVDAGDEPLIGDVQQGHGGGFVNAPALGLDDAILNLIGHAEAMATADAIGFHD